MSESIISVVEFSVFIMIPDAADIIDVSYTIKKVVSIFNTVFKWKIKDVRRSLIKTNM